MFQKYLNQNLPRLH